MTTAGRPVAFRPRAVPLQPIGLAAREGVAHRLALRLLEESDERLARWSGVSGARLLVILGVADDLPWVDGVEYLGRDARAPALLLPAVREPDVPAALFERMMLARGIPGGAPLAVTEHFSAGTGAARPVVRARLRAWLERELREVR